jgi:hypothetical protein
MDNGGGISLTSLISLTRGKKLCWKIKATTTPLRRSLTRSKHVEGVGIGVELPGGRSNAVIGLGQPLDGGDGFGPSVTRLPA